MKRAIAWALVFSLASGVALADDAANKEASDHFRRGVGLFGEADYRAALVEFKKAYQISPNASVLYNIAQTSYQLRDYASALVNFERYLAEGNPTGARRDEVVSTLDILRSRVGRIKIVTKAPDVEIAVDDETVGKASATPFPVSIGRRRITASHKGSPPLTRNVDVSAGETATVEIDFGEEPKKGPVGEPATPPPPPVEPKSSMVPAIVGYSAAGAFAVGATVTGILALSAKGDLTDERGRSGATRQSLDDIESRRKTFALVTDVLVAGAVVAAAVGFYFTVSPPQSKSAMRLRPSVTPVAGAALLEGSF